MFELKPTTRSLSCVHSYVCTCMLRVMRLILFPAFWSHTHVRTRYTHKHTRTHTHIHM